MSVFKKSALGALLCCFTLPVLAELPTITILATGGTIAGAGSSETQSTYVSGKFGVDQLVDAVPQLKDIAKIKASRS
ncbi:Probable L-asparaginase periplasmic precursor [Budvicia aquatica]|uniref:Probable L-asparaginase periplasmic n=1 Tax=Budvicia aquatica TaxID=82979 RepID=A0A484ZN40_9GAMM|nr:Probable L-asparaginase periplasmic precursor [Budvicia aquatica]